MSKLILTHEVTGLGAPGDVVDVKNGFARNYLIPQGFAVAWTRGGEKQIESIKAARAAREHATLEEAQDLKAKLAGDHGHAHRQGRRGRPPVRFGQDRGCRRRRRGGRPRHSRQAQDRDPAPIKATGEHEATVRLRDDLVATITLKVVAAK